jgi:hypothetical protein
MIPSTGCSARTRASETEYNGMPLVKFAVPVDRGPAPSTTRLRLAMSIACSAGMNVAGSLTRSKCASTAEKTMTVDAAQRIPNEHRSLAPIHPYPLDKGSESSLL